jgi:hypothetical protein
MMPTHDVRYLVRGAQRELKYRVLAPEGSGLRHLSLRAPVVAASLQIILTKGGRVPG